MIRPLIVVLMGLSAMVITLSILSNLGRGEYIDNRLLIPASIIFGAGMIALSILSNKSKD